MTDYSKLTDEELNRLVAERLTEWPDSDSYCTDPAAWGWLLERERGLLDCRPDAACYALIRDIGKFGESPGRAVAIAYLSADGGV